MYIGVTNYPDFLKTQSVQTTVAGQTSLTGLNYDPGNVEVYKNGVRLRPDQYAAPDGMNITLYSAAALNDKFDIVSREENAVGSDVVSVNGKTGVVVLDHYDFPDMPWLDGSGRIPSSLLPTSVVGAVVYQGTWNAASGSAPSASPAKGQYWVVSVQGTTSLSGINQWYVGDTAIYNGTAWDRLDGSANEVLSVNGRTGNVVITSADVTSALAFTPVQQGGGIGQTSNKVFVGWSTSGLKATVDVTDIGHFVMADAAGYIYAGGNANLFLLGNNKGLIHVGTDLPAFGAQYLRLRAEPSLWGSPYGELLIGSNGQNKFSGYTILEGGAETVTPAPNDNSSKVATTAFVQTAMQGFDPSEYVLKTGDTMSNSLTILGAGSGVLSSQSAYANSATASGWANTAALTGAFNNDYASQSVAPGSSSALITTNHPTFAIPVSASITGVTIRIANYVYANTLDVTGILQLKGSSFPSGGMENYFTCNTSSGSITVLGSSSDLLGVPTLTPAMVNDPAFGAKVSFATDFGDGGTPVINVDGIEITIHYVDIGVTGGHLFLGNSTSSQLMFDGSKYVLPNFPTLLGGNLTVQGSVSASSSMTINSVPVLTTGAGPITANFTKPLTVYGTGMVGSNATGSKFISTDAPSGGVDGDIWYRYSL